MRVFVFIEPQMEGYCDIAGRAGGALSTRLQRASAFRKQGFSQKDEAE
jgi:hypothetical protein